MATAVAGWMTTSSPPLLLLPIKELAKPCIAEAQLVRPKLGIRLLSRGLTATTNPCTRAHSHTNTRAQAYINSAVASAAEFLPWYRTGESFLGSQDDDLAFRRAIVYDHEDWHRHRSSTRHSRHMLTVSTSKVILALLPPVLILTLFASGLVIFNTLVISGFFPPWVPLLHVSSLPFQLTAPAVALLLVFRTNASYGRFDEARKAWGSVVNRSRDVIRQAALFLRCPADTTKLKQLTQYLVAFSYCLKEQLTGEGDLGMKLSGILQAKELEALMNSPHRPNYILQAMAHIIHSSQSTDMHKALMDLNVTKFHDYVGGCERIFKTPIPVAYTRLTSRLLVIWHVLLPLALWDQCTWATIPATFLSAAALFCIEEVGVLIEEPFSILPLGSMCNTIQQNVKTILLEQEEIQHAFT